MNIAAHSWNDLVANLCAASLDNKTSRIDASHFGRTRQHALHLAHELLRIPFMVIVQKSDVFAGRLNNSRIARSGSATPTIMSKITDGRAVKARDDSRGVICSAIIYHQDLQILVALPQNPR